MIQIYLHVHVYTIFINIKFCSQLNYSISLSYNNCVLQCTGKYPDLSEKIAFFEKAFDHEKARKEGIIIPQKGVNGNYDDAMAGVDMIKLKLDEYLQRQRKRLGCKVCEFTTFNRVEPRLNCDLLL